jgi:hypothetical protein
VEIEMTRKQWILITIAIALIHGLIIVLIMPISWDAIFSRFDGNPYESPWEPLVIGLFFLLNFPYYLLIYFAPPIRLFPPLHYLLWVGNSLVWGLIGAWLISKLPFMKNQDLTE